MEVYKILPKVRGGAQRAEGSVVLRATAIRLSIVIFTLILGAPIQYFSKNTWVQSYRKKGNLCFKKTKFGQMLLCIK